MAVPKIMFTDDSASVIECVTWVGKAFVGRTITQEALEDIPGTILVVSRVAHTVAEQVAGRAVFAEQEQVTSALNDLALKLGCEPEGFGAGGIGLSILLRVLTELLKDLATQV